MRNRILTVLLLALVFLTVQSNTADARKKPLIGITCGGSIEVSGIENSYAEAILKAGGIPMLIPCIGTHIPVEELLKKLDGIIFTGGEDCNPAMYGEEAIPQLGTVNDHRDSSDLALAKVILGSKIPVMAICRGSQFINVACGGTLYQDLPTQKGVEHAQAVPVNMPSHGITIADGSILGKVMKVSKADVNSTHHQAVKEIGKGLEVIAVSTDGVVEAYQNEGKGQTILGMQFHPEWLLEKNIEWLAIFKWFVQEAR